MKTIRQIEELKVDTLRQLYGLIINSQEDKDNKESTSNKTSRKIEEINKEFIRKIEEFGFKAGDSFIEYLSSKKQVVHSQITGYLQKGRDELFEAIRQSLGGYVEKLEYDEEIDDAREEENIKSCLACDDRDRRARKQNISKLIEDYIYQIRSRIISRLDAMDGRTGDLQSSINREILWKKPEEFSKFLDEEDDELYEQIQDKIQEFFQQVSQIKAAEKGEKDNIRAEFMQSIDARGVVDENEAINKAASEKRTE